MNEEQKSVEILINAAIMNVANEQAEMIKGVFRHKTKNDFNLWLKQGNKLMENLRKELSDIQIEMFENMTDVYHEQSESIRKQILNQ